MRSLILLLLAGAVAAPALAAPGTRDRDRDERRGPLIERVRSVDAPRDDRDERRGSADPAAAAEPALPRRVEPRPVLRGEQIDRGGAPVLRPLGRPDGGRIGREVPDLPRRVPTNPAAGWRERDRDGARPPVLEPRDPVVGSHRPVSRRIPQIVQRDVRQPTADLRRPEVAHRWREQWRRDGRHDWRSHRSRNRSLFRLGFYHDPFGWGYRRLGYGYSLYPNYYTRSYWLSDPYRYRLPYVYGPYRWVRYWDDALLVDMRSGMVVDVIHDVFW